MRSEGTIFPKRGSSHPSVPLQCCTLQYMQLYSTVVISDLLQTQKHTYSEVSSKSLGWRCGNISTRRLLLHRFLIFAAI